MYVSRALIPLLLLTLLAGSHRIAADEPPAAAVADPPASAAAPEAKKPEPEKKPDAESKSEEAKKAEGAAKEGAKDAKPEAPKNQVLLLAPSGSYVDLVGATEFDPTSLLLGDGPARRKSFFKLLEAIDEAARNPKLTHVVFDLSDAALDLNLAQLDELQRHLGRLKAAGKKLGCWLESASPSHLAVAAPCDRVVMADFGGVDMPSKTMQSIFYRDAMDLLGVKASVVRAGNFKGAVEPYVNSAMSEHLKKHYLDMLATMNDAEVSMIAKGRGLTAEKVRELQKARVLLPAEALTAGLVDELAPYGSLKATMNRWIGGDAGWTEAGAKPKKEMSLFELMGKVMSGAPEKGGKAADTSIAVMHLSGAITDGKRPSPGSIVSGPTVKTIQEILKDDKIKGVVVRINSPGGSATASEAIRQALAELAAKKPTVVSMGDVAASGGYWVSCIGVPVYAERGTLTGSIGVFSMKLSFGSLMKRVGLHVENIALDEAAMAFASDRGWNEDDQAKLQKTIDDVYGKFLKLVSDSRRIPVEKLQDLAGGRVWSGTQAKAAGLVDEIGGVDDCLGVVAKKAGLEKYSVVHRPVSAPGLDLSSLFGDPDSGEIRALGISTDALDLLRRRGLATTILDLLLQDGVRSGGRPTVWALGPAELDIR